MFLHLGRSFSSSLSGLMWQVGLPLISPRNDFTTRSGNATTTFTIRVVPLEGNPWFITADACGALELRPHPSHPGKFAHHLKYLGADERRTLEKGDMPDVSLFPGTTSRISIISESGLYKLIMRSDKPQARAFQDWVTKEVLPTIRKTGGYVLQGADRATVGEGTVDAMPDVGGLIGALWVQYMEGRCVPEGPMTSTALTVALFDNKPRILDTDLAAKLGMSRPRDV